LGCWHQTPFTPEQAGLPAYGGNRRVAGLRREEVALLAGVSVDYYTRLERGNLGGVSDSVLEPDRGGGGQRTGHRPPRGQTVATLLLVLVVIVVRERDATASRLLAYGRA
jgi:Helix-turn-helix domain